MIDAFSFMDGDRTFACSIATRGGPGDTIQWWWFGVTSDRHRYAPFRAAADDTEFSVRHRVVSYYDNLIARRALPSASYYRR